MIDIDIESPEGEGVESDEEMFERFRQRMQESIVLNFQHGGRPEQWAKKADGTASFLVDTGRLAASVYGTSGSSFAEVATDTPYAIFHQYGTSRMVKRELFLFQEEDIDWLENEVADNAMNKVLNFFAGVA